MRILIAEDEPPALARLVEALRRVAPRATVVGAVGSLQAARDWLAREPAPDLLLLDIQLADGLSLALFDPTLGTPPSTPVVFTTAHDAFVMEAFRCNAIDYLLKPVADAALSAALARYDTFSRHFGGNTEGLLAALRMVTSERAGHRQRLVVRRGSAFASLRCDDIAWLTSIDKLSFAVTRAGERLLCDASMAELQAQLDPRRFFRANRQTLVQIDAVTSFRPQGKGQLRLELTPPAPSPVVVSAERAHDFRDWIEGLVRITTDGTP